MHTAVELFGQQLVDTAVACDQRLVGEIIGNDNDFKMDKKGYFYKEYPFL